MFQGSANVPEMAHFAMIEKAGGSLNGSTWLDRTNYFETLPASQDNLDWALDLESDRMVNAMISPDDLKTEFSVVRNEFERDEDDPQRILGERISESAYLWHNYGKSVIGSRSDIERVPVPKLRAFYEKYYQPDNAVLIVSGKFDDAAALGSIEKTFGALAKPTRSLGSTYTIEPVQDGERRVELRRNGEVSVVGLAYHTLAGSSPDFAAVDAALDILTREPSGRLYKKLVETKLAASLYGWTQQTHDPSLSQLYAQVRDPKNVDKVEKIMISEIEGLASGKIDEKELERWRTASLKEIELAMANSQEIAVYLSEFAAIGDWRTMFAYRDRISKVTVADVQRVAKAYFKASNRTVGRFIPTKDADRAPLTTTPDVEQLVKDIQGGEVKDAGEVFAATLDNIEARTTRKDLKGGIKAALLPKKTRGGKVELALQLHWGDEKSLQNKSTLGSLLGAVMARGTQKHSYQDLHDLEDQLKAHIWISSSADGLTLHIETLRDKLAGALDLAAEMLTAPTFPDKELDLVRQEQLAGLEQQLADPGAPARGHGLTLPGVLGDAGAAVGHPRRVDAIAAIATPARPILMASIAAEHLADRKPLARDRAAVGATAGKGEGREPPGELDPVGMRLDQTLEPAVERDRRAHAATTRRRPRRRQVSAAPIPIKPTASTRKRKWYRFRWRKVRVPATSMASRGASGR
jgi:zinc protease